MNMKLEARKALFTGDAPELWEVGESVFIRTVTYHLVGKIINVLKDGNKTWLVLDEAAWVADSGRFTNAMNEGKLNEVEPVDSPIRINTDSITDVFCWIHPLPRKQQ